MMVFSKYYPIVFSVFIFSMLVGMQSDAGYTRLDEEQAALCVVCFARPPEQDFRGSLRAGFGSQAAGFAWFTCMGHREEFCAECINKLFIQVSMYQDVACPLCCAPWVRMPRKYSNERRPDRALCRIMWNRPDSYLLEAAAAALACYEMTDAALGDVIARCSTMYDHEKFSEKLRTDQILSVVMSLDSRVNAEFEQALWDVVKRRNAIDAERALVIMPGLFDRLGRQKLSRLRAREIIIDRQTTVAHCEEWLERNRGALMHAVIPNFEEVPYGLLTTIPPFMVSIFAVDGRTTVEHIECLFQHHQLLSVCYFSPEVSLIGGEDFVELVDFPGRITIATEDGTLVFRDESERCLTTPRLRGKLQNNRSSCTCIPPSMRLCMAYFGLAVWIAFLIYMFDGMNAKMSRTHYE